ncbi:metallophosphoesterase [Dyadobacter sp. CY312]|uniref:metallophosphoesterase family protein n=1 Tax=Dyadobacter sp. CY312 TaxID=2907303 RepID=UPI001F41976B|nr:metallophosphoesterase [Dyadobacter sp. CY312]MCE7039913.1 metallophosphoesterase [Dyadobacter sp. CY312]
MKTLLNTFILFTALINISCEGLFQYNPNQVILKEDERNLNLKNVALIQALPQKDTTRFILMGDTQRWYDESSDFIKSANSQRDISFVIHAGDISDFGLSQEFKWVNQIMQELKYPYVTVIGNHDIVANGPLVYKKMYGELDYSFEFGGNKFIFINTNSREYNFDGLVPNLPWLRSQLKNNPTDKNAIVIAHVPPFDADFDPNMQNEYAQILASDPNVKFTLYGHQHTFKNEEFYEDGVRYMTTTSMGARGYLIVTTWKGGYRVERVEF